MAEESIDVRIVTISGEEFSASVSFHDKVAVVKRQLALAMKIPRYRLKLSHREMLLDDQACLSFSVKPVTQPVHLSVAVLPDSGDVTEEQMAEFWEAFSIIDKPADSKITAKELGIAMRAVGQKPTQEELDDLLLDFPNGSIPFQAFVAMATSKRKEDDEESLIEEFKRWHEPDSNGFIGIEEFRHVLVNSGDKFSEEEIDEIIREVGVNGTVLEHGSPNAPKGSIACRAELDIAATVLSTRWLRNAISHFFVRAVLNVLLRYGAGTLSVANREPANCRTCPQKFCCKLIACWQSPGSDMKRAMYKIMSARRPKDVKKSGPTNILRLRSAFVQLCRQQ